MPAPPLHPQIVVSWRNVEEILDLADKLQVLKA